MSNLQGTLNKNKKSFIPFITAGDGGLDLTEELVYTLEANGANAIELGIPFSDPLAEGPVISNASARALERGVNTEKIFALTQKLKKSVKIPLIYMTYANLVFSYGADKFLKTASEAGVSAIILPDVPFEERDEFLSPCQKHNIDFISMISPTSPSERIKTISKNTTGFLYCVSSLGVTGMRNNSNFASGLENMVQTSHKANSTLPALIGFGISNPEQAKNMAKISDGVIIGSRIVKIVEEKGTAAPKEVATFARSIRNAIDEI